MLSIVSKKYKFVVGIDTHAKKHTYCLITNLGESICHGEIRVLTQDFRYLLKTIQARTREKKERILFAIEGTSSYGETLTRYLVNFGVPVCEVRPPSVKSRGGAGKTDTIDAEHAAKSVLGLPLDKLTLPRIGDDRKILRMLITRHNNITKQQTIDKNTLTSLVRSLDIGMDTRNPLDQKTIESIAKWREHSSDAPHQAIARLEAKRLSQSIISKEQLLYIGVSEIRQRVDLIAPTLLEVVGVGPICAANLICAYSHKGRIRSSAAFAALAGVAPIPASSGNITRYRLNPHGDRTLNRTLNIIAMSRMRIDERTKIYMQKRMMGDHKRTYREVRRILKRYIAREVFNHLEKLDLGVD